MRLTIPDEIPHISFIISQLPLFKDIINILNILWLRIKYKILKSDNWNLMTFIPKFPEEEIPFIIKSYIRDKKGFDSLKVFERKDCINGHASNTRLRTVNTLDRCIGATVLILDDLQIGSNDDIGKIILDTINNYLPSYRITVFTCKDAKSIEYIEDIREKFIFHDF